MTSTIIATAATTTTTITTTTTTSGKDNNDITTTTDTATTTITLPTTEKITIRPNAHQIRYTLDESAIVDFPSHNMKVETEEISGGENQNNLPISEEPISLIPIIGDDVSSEVTHNPNKPKKTSSESFLTTLVPLVSKTPSKTLSDDIPIFVAGTKQTEENLEDTREVILPQPVKTGRYILAATS